MAACVPAACGSRDERPAAPVFLPYEGPVQTNSIEGVWKGNLRLAGMDHVIVSTITRQEDGWSIVYDNPDMGERGMTASDVRFEGEILRFDIPARGASFLGTLSADGRSIDGGVRMMGRDIPLNLILVSMPDGGERS